MTIYTLPYLKPIRIVGVKDLHTLIFEGEHNLFYYVDFESSKICFCKDRPIEIKKETFSLFEMSICGLVMDSVEYCKWNVIVTSDGCIYFLNKNSGKIEHEYRACLQRLVSVTIFEEKLFVLSEGGTVYRIDIQEIIESYPYGHIGAIWDILEAGGKIVTSGADGRILVRDRISEITKVTFTKYGWINALEKYNGYVYFVTSCGILGIFDTTLNTAKILLDMSGQYWFNDFSIDCGIAYIASAEGYIIEVNLSDCSACTYKMTDEQIISLDLSERYIVVATVAGRVICIPLKNGNAQWEMSKSLLTAMHITSIALAQESIIATTIEGKLLLIPMYDIDKQCLSAYYYTLSTSRIWKVSFCNNAAYCADVRGHVFYFDCQSTKVFHTDTREHITSIYAYNNTICYGTRTGKIEWISPEEFTDEINTDVQKVVLQINNVLEAENMPRLQRGIELHYSKALNFSGRLLFFASKTYKDLRLVFHKDSEEFLEKVNIEWGSLPILLFNGSFLCGGFLLDEMWKSGFIQRYLESSSDQ